MTKKILVVAEKVVIEYKLSMVLDESECHSLKWALSAALDAMVCTDSEEYKLISGMVEELTRATECYR